MRMSKEYARKFLEQHKKKTEDEFLVESITKQPALTLKIRKYMCHPETCAHEEHYPYELYNDDQLENYFSTEREMNQYLKDNGIRLIR